MTVPDQLRYLPIGNDNSNPQFNRFLQIYDRLPVYPIYEIALRPLLSSFTTTGALDDEMVPDVSFSFRKEEDWTDLRVYVAATWRGGSLAKGFFFIQIDGGLSVPFNTYQFPVPAATSVPYTDSTLNIPGIGSGIHSAQLWVHSISTPALSMTTNDSAHVWLNEVVPTPLLP